MVFKGGRVVLGGIGGRGRGGPMRLDFCALCGENRPTAWTPSFHPQIWAVAPMKRICSRLRYFHGKIHDVLPAASIRRLLRRHIRNAKRNVSKSYIAKQRNARVAAASAYANSDILDFLLRPQRVCLTACTAARAFSLTRARDAAQHFADQAQRQR